MLARRDDECVDTHADAPVSAGRQWRGIALGLAILFATLPLASKLFLGSWGFDEAPAAALLCLAGAAYLHFAWRGHRPPLPDSAAVLDEAIRLAASGDTDRGIALLNEELSMSPRLWQARQYRGQLRLYQPEAAESALQDFTAAIRLAPNEPHLYLLRSHVFALLGRDESARADLETAARLSGGARPAAESSPAQ